MSGATTSVALLRGINVGRAKQVDMAALREVFTSLGATRAVTHLRSGNVVFDSPRTLAPAAIEAAVEAATGVSSSVVVLSAAELDDVVAADPFVGVADDPSRHLVVFLSEAPPADLAREFEQRVTAPDRARVLGRAAYLWCPEGVLTATGDVKLWTRAGIVATGRNWRTVVKLQELAGQ
ncbi:uncharacterized protein (DUF1697 family) [Motilibacter peucedani]|uniref:Uncharacterized protein (DUF1697 family) n=1 Tax=Motilibacter peucedani TaxID=598650 RepID=A0A420XKY6_9ACTN|nr:DUF1697 domain-containing protein [Motilibacter peucedani]RKS69321.1 uncharacterized protein (DUF1697 family) [Motilibacter peucedani]